MILLSAVPYDASIWQFFWTSIMKTIGSASIIGMYVFIAMLCIGVFKIVIRFWIN